MMMKKLLSLLLALCLLLSCAAGLAEAASEEETADVVMAYVNGKPVMLDDVAYYADYLAEQRGLTDPGEDEMRALYQEGLEIAMGYEIMAQKAEAMGFNILTDEEETALQAQVKDEWDEIVALYAAYYFGWDETNDEASNTQAVVNTLSYLESMGYTEEVLLDSYRDQVWYDKLVAYVCQGVSATEQDAYDYFQTLVARDQAYYEGNVMYYEFLTMYYGETSYYMPDGYRSVKQILLEVDEDLLSQYTDLNDRYVSQQNGEETEGEAVTLEQVVAAEAAVLASVQDKIDDIQTRLVQGESFETLIEEYNTDPGMTMEPYATEGYPVHMDSIMYDEAFVNAAFSVDTIGQVSGPAVGAYGIYIVKYISDIPGGAVEYTDELKAEMLEAVQTELESGVLNDTVDGWLAEADIIYTLASEDYLPLADAVEAEAE